MVQLAAAVGPASGAVVQAAAVGTVAEIAATAAETGAETAE